MAERHAPQSPAAVLNANGVCHNIDFGGHPAAREVTLRDGVPVSHLIIGYLLDGQPVIVDSPSAEWLDEMADAIWRERAMLAMWTQDHRVSPFGDDEPPAGVTGAAA